MYQLEGKAGKGHKKPRISPPEDHCVHVLHVQVDRNRAKDSYFSEARSSALKRSISIWTTHVAPSVSQLNTSKSSISSKGSVEATKAQEPDVEYLAG